MKTKAPVIDIFTREPLVVGKSGKTKKSAKVKYDKITFADAVRHTGDWIPEPLIFPESCIKRGERKEKSYLLYAIKTSNKGSACHLILSNDDLAKAKALGGCKYYKVHRKAAALFVA